MSSVYICKFVHKAVKALDDACLNLLENIEKSLYVAVFQIVYTTIRFPFQVLFTIMVVLTKKS